MENGKEHFWSARRWGKETSDDENYSSGSEIVQPKSTLSALVGKRIVNTDIWKGMNNRSWLSKILEILLWQEKITRLSKELSYNLRTRIVITIVTCATNNGKSNRIEVAIRRKMKNQQWRKLSSSNRGEADWSSKKRLIAPYKATRCGALTAERWREKIYLKETKFIGQSLKNEVKDWRRSGNRIYQTPRKKQRIGKKT